MLLFVYGSLRKKLWHNFYLENATFLGYGSTVKKFSLYVENNVIPKLSEKIRDTIIVGELYEVSEKDLAKVDEHEGFSGNSSVDFYTRKTIEIKSDKIYEANIYMCNYIENSDKKIKGDFLLHILANKRTKKFVQ